MNPGIYDATANTGRSSYAVTKYLKKNLSDIHRLSRKGDSTIPPSTPIRIGWSIIIRAYRRATITRFECLAFSVSIVPVRIFGRP